MSKTIEIVSKHTGKIRLCTRKGEQRTIVFEDKGGVGYALCDEDEADILLGAIGLPNYWKPGQGEGSQQIAPPITTGKQAEPDDTNTTGGSGGQGNPDNTDPAVLTKEGYESIKNVNELNGLLETCKDATLIMELVAIESQKDPSRSTWMKSLNDRLEDLTK